MALTDFDIRAIVARAEALQRMGDYSGDAEALIEAGKALGLSKSAMERAVRERLGSELAPADGDLVFARSADDKFYAAVVLASIDSGYRVRFLKGGERVVAADELRECPFLPGDRVTCPWPGWGAWTGTVVSYDAPTEPSRSLTDGQNRGVRDSGRMAGSANCRARTPEEDLCCSPRWRGSRWCGNRFDNHRHRYVESMSFIA